jgi:hypothetical protein
MSTSLNIPLYRYVHGPFYNTDCLFAYFWGEET